VFIYLHIAQHTSASQKQYRYNYLALVFIVYMSSRNPLLAPHNLADPTRALRPHGIIHPHRRPVPAHHAQRPIRHACIRHTGPDVACAPRITAPTHLLDLGPAEIENLHDGRRFGHCDAEGARELRGRWGGGDELRYWGVSWRRGQRGG
jgi:hypothetical protein